MGDGLQILYLLLAALFMLVVTLRRAQGQTTRWKISAAVLWATIFIILTFIAGRLGLRLPGGGGGF